MLTHLKIAVIGTLPCLATPVGAQDVDAGERVFRRCASCHQVGEDARNRTGPILNGVIGRPAGSLEDFRYSKSMAGAGETGLVWSEEEIFSYIEDPTAYLRTLLDDPRAKAKMTFKLRDEEDRRNVIAYLATFSPAVSDQTALCVTNGSEHAYLFASAPEKGDRLLVPLDPGETLCAPGSDHGTVSVFESREALEGCSRVVTQGGQETLLAYSEFDRCAWESNTN